MITIRRQFLKCILAGITFMGLPRTSSDTVYSIPFFNCMVAGFQYYDGLRLIEFLHQGLRLHLVREAENIHDPHAIAVHTTEGGKLGFISRYLNAIPAAHIDNGKKLHVVVRQADTGNPPCEIRS